MTLLVEQSLCSLGFQLQKIKTSEATLSGELTPYNIVPLEAQSLTNAIGVFPEVSWTGIQIGCCVYFSSPLVPANTGDNAIEAVKNSASTVSSSTLDQKYAMSENIISGVHSYVIAVLTLFVVLFVLQPSLILNSTQLMAISLYGS